MPPELYAALANIFDIDPKSFAKEMMRHCNFFSYQALFGSHPDLSHAALEKAHKLTIGKSNEDPKGDGGLPRIENGLTGFPAWPFSPKLRYP